MEQRYKVVVSSKFLYKEIELSQDAQRLVLGTGVNCDVRLHKSMFFEPIELTFEKTGDRWMVSCADNLYLTVGDARKLFTRYLEHGDVLQIKYQQSDNPVFIVDFLIDFDDGKRKYERAVEIGNRSAIHIGAGTGNDITLSSAYSSWENITLVKEYGDYVLQIRQSQYGIYHNGIKVSDGQKIKNGDFLSLADFFFYLKDNVLWTEIRNDMYIQNLSFQDYPIRSNYPLFKRNTRIKSVPNTDKIQILDPPEIPQKPKENIVLRLLPSMGMLLASGMMVLSGSGMVAFSLISGSIAILTAVLTYLESKKEYRQNVEKRYQTYVGYINHKRQEIQQYREQERKELERQYIDQNRELARFDAFSANLFERTLTDEDFLCVRLGTGFVESAREISYKKQERLEVEDALQMIPQQLYQEFRMIPNAPVVCDLKTVNGIGVYGQEAYRFAVMKNMIFDIAARQYFSDVRMFFVAEEKHKDKIFWLRMLPYVQTEENGIRGIVCNDESKNLVFEYLYKELTRREQEKNFSHRIVVFFYDEYGFNHHPISKFMDTANELGVTLIFFGEKKEHIPMGCGYLVELRDDRNAILYNTEDVGKSLNFTYPTLSDEDARKIVDVLVPVETEEISLEGTLVKNYSMFEMLNIIAVDDLDLTQRWASSQVFKSMAAPLGVSKTGMVYLDLHDKAHGPHGLVAGTTGSGKSEILQTYILSMATLFAPTEVSFVIIDFKGGGMVNQFAQLPHLLGAITNIDGKAINRSLKSIKAELQKRQRLFAEADVNHIDKYIRKFKAGEVNEPLPHLIIIVDEFAELKAEQPEFMKELISAARIGRSLGVHLILATQKPSGQVNEQIWSNSRFKLCLKVQSQQDSNEVLKSPLAAEIKEPGRAYLQVGNNEIFELLQSAYSGASEKTDDSREKEFTIYSLTDTGKRVPIYVQKKNKGEEGSSTQLDAIVRYVNQYCAEKKIAKLPDICLPALSEVIQFPEEQPRCSETDIIADIGIYDDPDNQYQGTYSVNLTNDNVMLIGSAQTGKTNVLQNIIRSITTRYSPEEVNLYIVDFASMVLKNYETLRHVGGVVTTSEDEKLKNLFKLLYEELASRRSRLISVGVSSFKAYREAGLKDMPQIVLMIDNLTSLRELYFADNDDLLKLCREGLSVGISVVIANPQTTGMGYRYLANFATRIATFCNDSSEYSSLFDFCRERVENIPGRALVDIEKSFMDCQMYLAFQGEKEIDRVNNIRAYIAETNRVYDGCAAAKRIPEIPKILSAQYVAVNFAEAMRQKQELMIGLDYATIDPVVFTLGSLGTLGLTGNNTAACNGFLTYAVKMLNRMHPDSTQVYILDSINRDLIRLSGEPNVARYEILPSSVPEILSEIETLLKERYEKLIDDELELDAEKQILLILNSQEMVEAICSNSASMNVYKAITGKYKNLGISVIVGSYPNSNIPYNAPEIFKKLKEDKHFLIFENLATVKCIDFPLSVQRENKKELEAGDCFYVKENVFMRIKLALDS